MAQWATKLKLIWKQIEQIEQIRDHPPPLYASQTFMRDRYREEEKEAH